MSIVNAVRNEDGFWINSQVFRQEAINFKKYGYYNADQKGSLDWKEYWTQQRRRCANGHSVGGCHITGEHYAYLNFHPIQKTEDASKKRSKKITDFADFWDGDYNYFWVREIARKGVMETPFSTEEEKEEYHHLDTKEKALKLAEVFKRMGLAVKVAPDNLEGGWNLIVGKSRRKGYSFKNASVAATNYICRPTSLTILGGYEKKFLYPKGLFTMAYNYINFMSANTAWVYPRDVINQVGKGHIKASYVETVDGVPVEKGFLSEIMSISFKDDPDSARGKDAYDFIIDEAGAFGSPGLLTDTLVAIQDCVMDGNIKTGLLTIFGTSGDMEGGTADYADMHTKPVANGFMPFYNIWDEDSEDEECGFFHPNQWNLPGYYDEQGNSNIEAALESEKVHRKFLLSKGATSSRIQKRMQERPNGPKEAFNFVSINNFPVLELNNRLRIVLQEDLANKKGTPVELYTEKGEVRVKTILDGTANPIHRRKPDNITMEGCPVIYEFPMSEPPRCFYKIGYDPYRQIQGTSLACIYVYKSVKVGELTKMKIVAEFVGRPGDTDIVNNYAYLFAKMYNTEVMHENEVTHVRDFFRRKRILNYLAAQPDAVIGKNVGKSKVQRVYGCHMIDKLKDAGEKYIKAWLTTVLDYDENGKPITVIDEIDSPGLLEELINYNRKGNFDRVMALMQVMFQEQEEEEGRDISNRSSAKKKIAELLEDYEELV